ncbi:hypothetical protein CL656_05570 [bacterium]|nr:hypothetical protein [bacterium]
MSTPIPIPFGLIITKCKTDNVVNKIESSNLCNSNEDFGMILNHLKKYCSELDNIGIKIPSDVIFLDKIDEKQQQQDRKFIENSRLGKLNIFTFDINFEKIIESYCDEYSDPFHYIMFNPVTIFDENEIDIDDVCAELLVNTLIIYVKHYKNNN